MLLTILAGNCYQPIQGIMLNLGEIYFSEMLVSKNGRYCACDDCGFNIHHWQKIILTHISVSLTDELVKSVVVTNKTSSKIHLTN